MICAVTAALLSRRDRNLEGPGIFQVTFCKRGAEIFKQVCLVPKTPLGTRVTAQL